MRLLDIAPALLIAFSLVGYPGLALLSGCMGLSPFWFAIPYRSCIALTGIFLGLYFWKKNSLSTQQKMFIFFLCLLGLRLLDNFIHEFPSSKKELSFFFAAVVFPIFGIIKQKPQKNEKYLGNILISICGLTIIFAILAEIFGWLGNASLTSSGRLSSVYLNPIILGNTGGLLLLAILAQNRSSQPFHTNAFGWVATCLGILGLSFANSRGPIIAFLGTLLFAFFNIKKNQANNLCIFKGIAMAVVLILLVFYNPLLNSLILDSIKKELPKNQQTQVQGYVPHTDRFTLKYFKIEERPHFLQNSWQAFRDNFWFGISDWQTFKQGSGHHAHNIFLGIFQNLGIFGGLLFFALTGMSVLQAKNWLRSGHFLVPFLFMQSLLCGQFSGALFGQTQLFISMAILLGGANTKRFFQ
jgi:hypothetical protein